jgi:8-oxo-dGTP pyrophosphatase MutT (NUDIX family)
MKIIRTTTEKDFGRQEAPLERPKYRIRKGASAVLLDDESRVALMHVASDNYYKLPGGGLDSGEDAPAALKRELLEEVGASSIEIISEIGQIDEYRGEWGMKGEHYCFLAKLDGPVVDPSRTEEEVDEGYETVWAKDIEEAIKLVESGTPKQYGHDFERLRELTFLQEVNKQTICTDFYGKEHWVDTANLIDRTSVYGVYVADNSVLLIQDPNSLRWELPGGGVELRETIREGLVREFIEEAGVVPGGQFRLLREWTEFFFDTDSKQAWRAQRKFYLIEKIESGELLAGGNGIDTATARMVPLDDLGNLNIMPAIKETVLLAAKASRLTTHITYEVIR